MNTTTNILLAGTAVIYKNGNGFGLLPKETSIGFDSAKLLQSQRIEEKELASGSRLEYGPGSMTGVLV